MDEPLLISLLILAAASWGVFIVAGIALVGKRSPDVSLFRLWFDGMRWFRPETFRPEARGLWYVFLGGFVAFFACILAVALLHLLFV